jgi:hypothetical protein
VPFVTAVHDPPFPGAGTDVVDVRGAELAARAASALRANDAGSMTRAAPRLYPHQWSWDAAFVSVGIAHLDPGRACAELDSLFRGQWATGMLPHIVFDPAEDGYFPGPDRWACAEVGDAAPRSPRTSGICQPPVHALAVERIVAVAESSGAAAARQVRAWLPGAYRRLLAWHRYLARERDPLGTGLLAVHHGWETGMDNSPRWDRPYAHVVVPADLPPYARRDTVVVPDAGQRPTAGEYDRYVAVLEELKGAGYDDARIRAAAKYRTTDVFASAVFAAASDALTRIGRTIGAVEVDELEEHTARFRAGVARSVDAELGLAVDADLRTGEQLRAQTVAGFAPLLCGGLEDAAEDAMVALLRPESWTGHRGAAARRPPDDQPAVPGLPVPLLLARSHLAGDQLVLRLAAGATGSCGRGPAAAAGGARAAGRGIARRVLRAVHRRAAGQRLPVLDGGRGAGPAAHLTVWCTASTLLPSGSRRKTP